MYVYTSWLLFILGDGLLKLENEKGIIMRFVIGHRLVYLKVQVINYHTNQLTSEC